jgi:hypothetical protein
MFYSEDHLRITKIRTTDGTTPVIGPDEKPVKKIIFAPNTPTARKLFEDQNTRLPNGLKMKIELIPAYKPEPAPFTPGVDEEKEALKKELAALKQTHDNLMNSQSANKELTKEPPPGNETAQNGQTKQHASK